MLTQATVHWDCTGTIRESALKTGSERRGGGGGGKKKNNKKTQETNKQKQKMPHPDSNPRPYCTWLLQSEALPTELPIPAPPENKKIIVHPQSFAVHEKTQVV